MKSFSNEQIEQIISDQVAERAGVATTELRRETHFRDDLEFDSLDFVEMTMELEDTFGLSIPDADAEPLQTVGAVIDYVVGRVKNAPVAA